MREERLKMEAEVQRVLGWTDERYQLFRYTSGLEYLSNHLPVTEKRARKLEGSELFWKWWISCWMKRERDFLHFHGHSPIRTAICAYERIHEVGELQVHPFKTILDSTPKAVKK